MNNNTAENKCLAIAHDFVKESAKSIGFSEWKFGTSGEVQMNAVMLGNIAADKYRACISQAEKVPAAAVRHKTR